MTNDQRKWRDMRRSIRNLQALCIYSGSLSLRSIYDELMAELDELDRLYPSELGEGAERTSHSLPLQVDEGVEKAIAQAEKFACEEDGS